MFVALVIVELVVIWLVVFREVPLIVCPDRLPVEVKLETVVDASVDEPVTDRLVVVVNPDVFVVVAFVVEAFNVAKLPVVPHNVVIVAVIAEKMFDQRF